MSSARPGLQSSRAADRLARVFESTPMAALPGVVVFVALWLVVVMRVGFGLWVTETIQGQWQSLGVAFLQQDPLASLAVMHIQPPLLNGLYAVDLALTPDRHLVLAAILLGSGVGAIVLLVDALRRSAVSGVWAAAAGLVYALLPSSVLYATWGYSVAPVAFLAMAAVWGVALARMRPQVGVASSAVAMLALVLMRPSFVWVLLVLWSAALLVLLARATGRKAVGAAVVLVAVASGLGVQWYYWQSFGLATMSSWSGENIAKALFVSRSLNVTPEARSEINADPCLGQMLTAYEVGTLNRWDDVAFRGLPACAALPPLAPKGVAAWDDAQKGGVQDGNFNFSDRLVASREWTKLMSIVVRHDPGQLMRMALTTEYGPTGSGLGLYLSPAENYPFITRARDVLPTAIPTGVLSLVFAPFLLVTVIAGWVQAIAVRSSRLRRDTSFWFASGLLAVHLVSNTMFEYSENMRYRAEIDPVLLFVGVVAAVAIISTREDSQ